MNNPYTLVVGTETSISIKSGDTSSRIQVELRNPDDSAPILSSLDVGTIKLYIQNKKDKTNPIVLSGDIDDVKGVVGFSLEDYSRLTTGASYKLEVVINYTSGQVGVYSSSANFELKVLPSLVRDTYI